MGNQAEVVEFTSAVTSITVARSAAGTLETTINVEGSSKAYGPFVGTFTAVGANKGGSWHYEAFAMPSDGANLIGQGDGSYEAVGPGRWRTLGVGALSSDEWIRRLRLDGEFNLEQRSWNGRLIGI